MAIDPWAAAAAAAERNWLVFKLIPQEGRKPRKVPCDHRLAGNLDREAAATLTLAEATQALEGLRKAEFKRPLGFGIGYLPRPGSALVAVDLDHVLEDVLDDAQLKKRLKSWGRELIGDAPATLRITPSGFGLRILLPRADGDDWQGEVSRSVVDPMGGGIGWFGDATAFVTIPDEILGDDHCITYNPGLRRRVHEFIETRKARREHSAVVSNMIEFGKHRPRNYRFGRLPGPEKDRVLASALAVIPGNDRDDWLRITMACRSSGAPSAERIWDEWSARWAGYDAAANAKTWASLSEDGNGSGSVTMGTVFHTAKEHGWTWPEAAVDMAKYCPVAAAAPVPAAPPEVADAFDMMHPPGLLGRMMDLAEKTSNRQTRLFGLVGGLVAIAVSSGHKWVVVTDRFETPLNLMTNIVVPSGGGKEEARQLARLGCEVSAGTPYIGAPASAPALHAQFVDSPRVLISIDEFGRFLKAASGESGGHDYQMITTMMRAFTSALGVLEGRRYSNAKDNKPEVKEPFLNAVFATTPDVLMSALTDETATDGFLGRILTVMPAEEAPLAEGVLPDMTAERAEITAQLRRIAQYQAPRPVQDGPVTAEVFAPPRQRIIPDEDAAEYLRGIRREIEGLRVEADPVIKPLWARAFELVLRVAGNVALGCASDLSDVRITMEVAGYSAGLVMHCIRTIAPDVEANAAGGEFEGIRKALMQAFHRKVGEDGTALVSGILKACTNGRGRPHRMVRDELDAMCDCDGLDMLRYVSVREGAEWVPAKPARVMLPPQPDTERQKNAL